MGKRVFLMIAVNKPFKEKIMDLFQRRGVSLSDVVREHLQKILDQDIIEAKLVEDDGVTVVEPAVEKVSEVVTKAPGGGSRPGLAMAEAAAKRIDTTVSEDDDDAYWG